MSILNKNRGVALVTVMLIVALAAVIATEMTARLQLQLARTVNITMNQQAYWYAMGAEAFAKRVLIESFKDEPDVTHLEQKWAQGETTFPVEFGQITGEITDLQSCFNLNSLVVDDGNGKLTAPPATTPGQANERQKILIDLIEGLDIPGIDQFEAESMADALTDWLDSDSVISNANGAEDDDYMSKEFPYMAANNYLASMDELRVVEHFTPLVIHELKKHACIIPGMGDTLININTLNDKGDIVLAALFDISKSDAAEILDERDEKGYKDIAEFLAAPTVAKFSSKITQDKAEKLLTVDSEYFQIKASTQFNDSYFAMTSIFKIDNNKKVAVIGRYIGH